MKKTKPETVDTFFERYSFKKNPFNSYAMYDGAYFGLSKEEKEYVKEEYEKNPKRVWTGIESPEGEPFDQVIINGYHYLHRIGFYITEQDGDITEMFKGGEKDNG